MGKDENGVNEEWSGKGKSGKKVREKELSQSEKGVSAVECREKGRVREQSVTEWYV